MTKAPKVREFLTLLGVALENHQYRRRIAREERRQLAQHSWYRALVGSLERRYRWSNPFRLSKRAKRKLRLPKEDLVYGETPILTAWQILALLQVGQSDRVVECGAGRAIFSLVAASAYGCSASVLEVVPSFVKKTQEVVSELGLHKVEVLESDILKDPIPDGTIYFVTATTFSATSWARLDRQLAGVAVGARAVSLSVPLNPAYWQIDKAMKLPFSWGDNTVYFLSRR